MNHGMKRDYGIWTIFSHIMANPTFVISNWTSKLIITLITTFVFLFMICCLKNVITTDQLILKEQKVYRSLEEIVEGIESGINLSILYNPPWGTRDVSKVMGEGTYASLPNPWPWISNWFTAYDHRKSITPTFSLLECWHQEWSSSMHVPLQTFAIGRNLLTPVCTGHKKWTVFIH